MNYVTREKLINISLLFLQPLISVPVPPPLHIRIMP